MSNDRNTHNARLESLLAAESLIQQVMECFGDRSLTSNSDIDHLIAQGTWLHMHNLIVAARVFPDTEPPFVDRNCPPVWIRHFCCWVAEEAAKIPVVLESGQSYPVVSDEVAAGIFKGWRDSIYYVQSFSVLTERDDKDNDDPLARAFNHPWNSLDPRLRTAFANAVRHAVGLQYFFYNVQKLPASTAQETESATESALLKEMREDAEASMDKIEARRARAVFREVGWEDAAVSLNDASAIILSRAIRRSRSSVLVTLRRRFNDGNDSVILAENEPKVVQSDGN